MPKLDKLFGPVPQDIRRYSTLDGFRALAILLLVVGHYAPSWPPLPGFGAWSIPVDVAIVALFVLTGFLVTERLLGEWDRTGDIAIGPYWLRKIVRFYPAFAAFVLFSSAHHLLVDVDVPLARVLTVLGLTGNYYYALAEDDSTRHIIGHLWSVAVGAQFLVVWPWLLLGALKFGWTTWLVRGATAAIIASMCLRTVWGWFAEVPAVYAYNATESRIDALLIGSVLALGLREPRVLHVIARFVGRPAIAWCALAALLVSLASDQWYRAGPGYSVEALLIALLLVSALRAERSGGWSHLRSRYVHAVSTMSFSFFLWHLYPLTVDSYLGRLPMVIRIPLTLLATVLVCAAAYLVLERPFIGIARGMAIRAEGRVVPS